MTLGNVQANRCAKWFTARGIPVFPCVENGKRPANHNGLKGAVLDAETIDQWWPVDRVATAYNLGVPTGVVFDVIDLDPDHGGFESVASNDWSWVFDQPSHAVVATQSGGLHLWHPRIVGRRNSANMAPGIDMRAEGGYVVAPPSATTRGVWRFVQPYHPEPRMPTDREAQEIASVLWTPRTDSKH